MEQVEKLYSVSLVYENQNKKSLRVLITEAINKDEALGSAISDFREEMKDYSISMTVVLEIPNLTNEIEVIDHEEVKANRND